MVENGTKGRLDIGVVIQSLVEDIKSKPGDRVSELLLASKLLGLLDKAKEWDVKMALVDADIRPIS